MQKQEFEERIERTVTDEQYKVIEEVYMWHPSIRNTSGKDEVAELYKSFGMGIFYDMLPRAEKTHELENWLSHTQAEVEQIRAGIKELSRCNDPDKVQATLGALEEHLKISERQRQRDRKAIELSEKESRLGGLCVVEPTIYDTFLNMSGYEFGRFIRDWIRRHLKDDELCIGQVERMFQTPVSIYKQQFNHLNKK